MKFLFGVAIAGSILGGLILVGGLIVSNGAPQEAAVAAIAVAFGVLPYCLARAAYGMSSIDAMTALQEQQKVQTKLLAEIGNKLLDDTGSSTEVQSSILNAEAASLADRPDLGSR
jgi:hypothetical protein